MNYYLPAIFYLEFLIYVLISHHVVIFTFETFVYRIFSCRFLLHFPRMI
jgi:hypothetical protein